MSVLELELEKEETPRSIFYIKNLITIGKFDKALRLLKICKENLCYSDQEKILYQLLEFDILYQQGLYEKLFALAKQIYKERLKLGDKLIAVDMLNLMADCLLSVYKEDNVLDIIKESERLLKILTQKSSKGILQREAYLAYVKGFFNYIKKENEKSLEYFRQSATLGENLSNKLLTILSLMRISHIYVVYKGELKQASIYIEKGLILAKNSNHKFAIAYSYKVMAGLYFHEGKIDKSIFFNNQSLTIFKKLNSPHFIAFMLNNLSEAYRAKGNLKAALDCIKKCIAINHDLGVNWSYANNHSYLIQILVDLGNFQKAKQNLNKLKILNNQLKNKPIEIMYLFDKALILKGIATHAKRVQAKEIFKQLIRTKITPYEIRIKCLLNLCEILLDELHDTNNVELLNKVPLYTNQIVDIAIKQNSYSLLAETYLFKANFDSFTLNLDNAESNLTKAQNVAERYGLAPLVQRILVQRENLIHQKREWQKLNDVNKVLIDFTNFTPLKEQIRYMIKKRSILKDLII